MSTMTDAKEVELQTKAGQGAEPSISRKRLKEILASRNAEEDDKTRKSVKAMADIGGLDGLMAKLGCDQKQGIAANTVDLRLEKYGRNELDDVRLPTYLELCWEALQDPIMLMLLASAFVTPVR